jgi:hypothetical protein
MYQFSRAIYRELAPHIHSDQPDAHAQVVQACERTMQRLAGDRHYFARPARTLFCDVRVHFPMTAQERVWRVVSGYVAAAERWLEHLPANGVDANGDPVQCRATTRRGTPCQRIPLPRNGYCPSHQHLADTEQAEAAAALAA